jgi:hypothetical protein
MALPWIIGGLVVAGVGYLATKDDDSTSSSDREDREREAKQRAREEQNEKIYEEISQYKEKQKKEIKKKYNTIIDFISENSDKKMNNNSIHGSLLFHSVMMGHNLNRDENKIKIISKNKTFKNEINALQKENKELGDALKEMEKVRNETFK